MDIFETLGVTKDELREQIIERAADRLLDGGDDEYERPIRVRVGEIVKGTIDEAVTRMFGEAIEPHVISFVEGMVFQKTNSYGEPKAPPETWREYLERRTTEWLGTSVNYEGQSQDENKYGSWNKSTTRVAFMIHKHLHFEIDKQLTAAVQAANNQIAGGLNEAVKIALADILGKIKVQTTVKP